VLSRDQLDVIEAATGVTSSVVEALTLSVYDGVALQLDPNSHRLDALHRRSIHDLVLRHVTAGSGVETVAADYLLGERIAPNALNHRLWVLRTSAYRQSICAALVRLSDYLDGVGAPSTISDDATSTTPNS
jgi:hypothetical protein